MSSVRKLVCRSMVAEIARVDGSSPPGKMYFWIQVWVWRLASIRAWGMVITWIATRPPGRTSCSSIAKYRGHAWYPTASIISTDTHSVVAALYVAVIAQFDLHAVGQPCRGNPKLRQPLLFD